MSNRFTAVQTTETEVDVSLTESGISIHVYGDARDCEPLIAGEVTIENIVDGMIADLVIFTQEPAKGIMPTGFNLDTNNRRLTVGSMTHLVAYREMLLRGVERIDQYMMEIGDE